MLHRSADARSDLPFVWFQAMRTDSGRPSSPTRFQNTGLCECRPFLAPSHSITSSAQARSADGRPIPSVLAGLRLTISSKVVGCWTGNSPGWLSANRNLADGAVSARTLLRNKRQSQYTGIGKKPWKAL